MTDSMETLHTKGTISLVQHAFKPHGGTMVLEMHIHLMLNSVKHFIISPQNVSFLKKVTIIYISITLLGFSLHVYYVETYCSITKR